VIFIGVCARSSKIFLGVAGFLAVNGRMEKSDQFRELFRMQKALNERIGVKTDCLNHAYTIGSRCALERKVG